MHTLITFKMESAGKRGRGADAHSDEFICESTARTQTDDIEQDVQGLREMVEKLTVALEQSNNEVERLKHNRPETPDGNSEEALRVIGEWSKTHQPPMPPLRNTDRQPTHRDYGTGHFGTNTYTGRDIPLPRQSEFLGKPGSWRSFSKAFENLAAVFGWNNELKRFRLLQCLKGDAAEFAYEQLDDNTLQSYGLLWMALENRFGERTSPNAYLAQLEGRKMGTKETLSEYTADLQRLVLKGYPTADPCTRDTIALRHFLRGLGDQSMIVSIGMREPKSLEDARLAAETYIGLRDDSFTKPRFNVRAVKSENLDGEKYVTETMFIAFKDEIKQSLTNSMNNLRETMYNMPRNSNRKNHGRCYNCDKEGHLARECPEPKRERGYRQSGESPSNRNPTGSVTTVSENLNGPAQTA